jgi:hypothetical protein
MRSSLHDLGLSQFKLGLLEGIEAIVANRPTDWRASGLAALAPPDEPFWLPPHESLVPFNAGIEAGFAIVKRAGLV